MWQQNRDTSEWLKVEDKISKTSFEYLKQEIESTRLYQVCLSGASFLNIKGTENIYEVLNYTQSYYWIINTFSSTYSQAYSTTYSISITPDNLDDYHKYLIDYGFTLKTKFTPKRLLSDYSFNFKEVDVATNVGLSGLGTYQPGLRINDILLKEGHLVLVKDQTKYVNLSNTIQPENYFTSSYFIETVGSSSTTYSVYTNENGIYKYENETLVRTSHLDDYNSLYNLGVSVKLNNSFSPLTEQYQLDRLPNGFFPEYNKGESVAFSNKKNYLLRNRVDYNNIYEIYYNDIAKFATSSFDIAGLTFSVPTRTISIGEFGVIFLHQSGYTTILPNKYKQNLNSISENTAFYWICGNRGHLLKVSKVDFEITKVELNELHDLKSIQFLDNLNGVVVGKFNTIYLTEDGGKIWTKISKPEFDSYSYTKVLYHKLDKIFIGGESGLFIEMDKIANRWTFYKRMIVKDLDTTEPTEDYLLVDDIRDMVYVTYSYTTWPLTYSFATQSAISSDKEVLFIATNNNNIVVKDINGFDSQFEFKYLSFTTSTFDINSIAPINGSSSFYIAADNIYKLNLKTFNLLGSHSNLIESTATPSIVHDEYANKIYNYNSQQLLVAGNNSLLKYTGLTESIFDIDASFENYYKSKMLFLEYDIASKLNFFDDQQQYRLPNSVSMTASQIGNWLSVSNIEGEHNWLTYYKDFEKTFTYYTSLDTSNQVLFSTAFTYSADSYYTMSSSSITGATADILPLAPNILSMNSPLIIASSSAISNTGASTKSLFISRHLIIFKKSTSYSVDIGDVMYLGSDVIKGRFVVNKLVSFGADKFIYCYHDFEQGVLNDLLDYTGVIHIINLNKFTSVEEVDGTQIAYNNIPFEYPWTYDNDINPDDYFAYAPWNNPNLYGNLLFNFNIHPVAYGYKLSLADDIYTLEPRFNNRTSYYNMQSKIETEYLLENMVYTDKFMNFGYKPTYNLLDYLSNIEANVFTASKIFYAMPAYTLLPGNAGLGFTDSNIYFDTNPLASTPWPKNKLLFGKDLYFEWNSIWLNTFVDVFIIGNDDSSQRMFVMKKYYDAESDGYVIEFHKELTFTNYSSTYTINITSRRTLQQISDDLQVLNNIHRSDTTRQLMIPGYEGDSFVNLTNELNFKFNTDSYAKILLSDKDIKDYITAIIFTDQKNELCLNVLNLEKQNFKTILNTSAYNISGTDYLQITTSEKHSLQVKDSINLYFNGGTASSEYLNRSYFGFQFVKLVVDEFNFVTEKLHSTVISGTDSGYLLFLSRDPYFNFQPVDIMEIGVDSVQKKANLVEPKNIQLQAYTYSLVNLDFNKYRYQLVDDLTLNDIYERFSWLLEGNINEAIIGRNSEGIVWYKGIWECGRWFNGLWLSGTWLSGDWYDGIWNSNKITGNRLVPIIDSDKGNVGAKNSYSEWFGGRWFDGTWNAGTWYAGKLYNVEWKDGVWMDGIWNYGIWNKGEFKGGIWIDGEWRSGVFNSSNKPAYWIDGTWKAGDFENGIWYDGNFNSDNGLSRFGTKAFNTRTAIWHGGIFRNSEFHSYLNSDIDGTPIQSEYYKYSQWNAGIFNGGNWYGGVAMAINFTNGNWYGGVVEDIQIIGFQVFTQSNNAWGTEITLNGIYYLNLNDEIWIINNENTIYDYFGSKENPKKYLVKSATQIGNTTKVLLDRDLHNEVETIQTSQSVPVTGLTSVSNTETQLRMTANFRESIWKSGVWTNGIFESGFFEGGIWYGGNFRANWGR